MKQAFLLILMLFTLSAFGQEFRCMDEEGEYWSTSPCRAGEEHPEDAAPASGQVADPCLSDWECLRRTYEADADLACRLAVEQSAAVDYRWLTGMFTTRFSIVRAGANRGVIQLAGDRIELQNRMGNWIRHRYLCNFDAGEKRLVTFEIEPGRLP